MLMNRGFDFKAQVNKIPYSDRGGYRRLNDKAMNYYRKSIYPLEQAYENSNKPILTKKERKKLEKEKRKREKMVEKN
ncbi:MAG: hypothetical protein HRT57_13100 [Crocinitomicaceae bacterium]|nr:hypothetical protein [Crocinitomicaceae bacterium]